MENLHTNYELQKYIKSAEFILPLISDELKQFFDNMICGSKAENYILDLIKSTQISLQIEPITKDYSLKDLICICLYIALSKESITSATKSFKEGHRVNKRHLMKSIKEEMEIPEKLSPRNPKLLRNYAQSLHLIESTERKSADIRTVEQIMTTKYEELEVWRLDHSQFLTSFCFITQKPAKTIANCFINDLTLSALHILELEYGGSIDGFNTKLPTALNDASLFSYKNKATLEFIPQIMENEIFLFNSYKYEDEETIHEVDVNFSTERKLPTTYNNPNAIPNFLKKYDIDLNQPALDLRDKDIITYLFNQLNGDNIGNSSILIESLTLIRNVYDLIGPVRSRHYNDLYERLEKIKRYNYKISIRSKATGDIVESSTLGLLNYLHIAKQEGYFLFSPSDQLIKTYIERKYFSILTDTYKIVESPQTRAIMTMLQQIRLTEYIKGSLNITLPLNFFRNYLKLDKITNAALIKELTKHFDYLRENSIILQTYKFINRNSAVVIDFLSLDEKELRAYELGTSASTSENLIIDSSGQSDDE